MPADNFDHNTLRQKIEYWGKELGFSQIGFSDVDLSSYEEGFKQWLAKNFHGNMEYMAKHGTMRTRPAELVEGTLSCISVRLDYLPVNAQFAQTLKKTNHAYVSRYALGRDYHKLMRKKLKALGNKIRDYCEHFNFRPFVDSAPLLERPLAEKAGLGWTGKHSLVINKNAGSWFFLGELLINIPLNADEKTQKNECGQCVSCIKICPTGAIVEPYVVDARRCISYLTIELKDAIPIEFRSQMGNRIYGCDDCQLICPWNKFAKTTQTPDFNARENLDNISLVELFAWDEATFLRKTEGSPIRRIGYECWQRNIAIALGNAPFDQHIVTALQQKLAISTAMVVEHIEWALKEQDKKIAQREPQKHDLSRLTGRLIRTIEKGLPRDA